jgi:hypothetical protein
MIAKNQLAIQRKLEKRNRRILYALTWVVITRLSLRVRQGNLSKWREGVMKKRFLAWQLAYQWGNGWQVARAVDQAKRWLDFDEEQNGKIGP